MDDKTMNKAESKVGRRRFLKGAMASGVAGVVASNPLMSVQKEAAQPAACKMSWEIPPAPIPAGEIKNTVNIHGNSPRHVRFPIAVWR